MSRCTTSLPPPFGFVYVRCVYACVCVCVWVSVYESNWNDSDNEMLIYWNRGCDQSGTIVNTVTTHDKHISKNTHTNTITAGFFSFHSFHLIVVIKVFTHRSSTHFLYLSRSISISLPLPIFFSRSVSPISFSIWNQIIHERRKKTNLSI